MTFLRTFFFAFGGLVLGGVRYGILFLKYFFADVAVHIDNNTNVAGRRPAFCFYILHAQGRAHVLFFKTMREDIHT